MNIPATINPVYLANMDGKLSSVQSVTTNTAASINTCTSCSELSALKGASDEILAEFNKSKKTIEDYFTDQLAEIGKSINGLLPLLVAPGDLGGVISWITNMITNLQGPYTKVIALQAEMIAKQTEFAGKLATQTTNINNLQSSIAAKSATLNCGL